jgi:multiple sugar transport system ATP-binding protein
MAAIGFTRISKRFGVTPVLTDLNLSIEDREFMVLVGPSGCGKSTALRLIAGLEDPTAGVITIGGRDVLPIAPKDRDVAMVFQSYALYPHLSVAENIGFSLSIRGTPKPEITRRVAAAAETLGLSALLDRKPAALSGGQRQRVALGRAIVREPSVFLFDEPLSNLDAELRVQMRAELARLQKSLATTTVYVTHDQVEAMTLGHRIAVLAPTGPDGRPNLMQVGTPLEIYDRPANAFVAHFMGSPPMNLLPAQSDGAVARGVGYEIPLVGSLATLAGQPPRRILIGIRPEHLHEPGQLPSERSIAIAGSAEIAETIGAESLVHLAFPDARLIARLASRRIPAYGERVTLAMDHQQLHAFDAATGLRL